MDKFKSKETQPLIILGVDPGSRTTGLGIVQIQSKKPFYLFSEAVKLFTSAHQESFQNRLYKLYIRLQEVIKEFNPNIISLEKIFLGKNVQSAFKLGQVRGVVLLVAEMNGVPVFEYSPREVKLAVSGFGGASKDQILKMIQIILGVQEKLSPDASDALSIALTHYYFDPFRKTIRRAQGLDASSKA